MDTANKSDMYFNSLLSKKVDISRSQRDQGIASHNHARKILRRKNEVDSTFLWLMDSDFLSGSFARKTKLKPLDDIDVMMVIDGGDFYAHDQRGVYGRVEGTTSNGNPLHAYTDMHGNVRSSSVVDSFAKALAASYPNATKVRKNHQAINIWFSSYELGIDIVPCFKIIPNDSSENEHYFIPAGNGSDQWIKTNPKLDNQLVQLQQSNHDGMFKSLVKIIKFWNQGVNKGRLSSYHLELMVAVSMHNKPSIAATGILNSLIVSFEAMELLLSNSFNDLWGLGEPVDRYLDHEKRTLSQQSLAEALTNLRNARRLETLSNHNEVLKVLAKTFDYEG